MPDHEGDGEDQPPMPRKGGARWIEPIHDERVCALRAKHPDKGEALVRTRPRFHVNLLHQKLTQTVKKLTSYRSVL